MSSALLLLFVVVYVGLVTSVHPAAVGDTAVGEAAVGEQQIDAQATAPRAGENSGAGQLLLDYLQVTSARQANSSRRCIGSLWRQALSACRMRELADAMIDGRSLRYERPGENDEANSVSNQRNLRPTKGILLFPYSTCSTEHQSQES